MIVTIVDGHIQKHRARQVTANTPRICATRGSHGRLRVECARCGHTEDETYEFDMPLAEAQPMEAYEPGKCPECGASIHTHLKRTQQRQLLWPTEEKIMHHEHSTWLR